MSEPMSLKEIEQADIQRLFKEFKENLFSYLPDRYPIDIYAQWRLQALYHLEQAEYCAKHAHEHLSEEAR